jgi:hypothetical protein
MEVSAMISGKKIGILLLGLGVLLILAGTTACQKKAAEAEAAPGEEGLQEVANEFEGQVRTAFGKYLYLDTAQGFDIVLQGYDASSLVGKDVKVIGELLQDKPSIFRADSVEVKSEAGSYSNVFTRSEELVLEDFVDTKTRESYPAINISGVNRPEEWENKGQAKVYGLLSTATVKEGDAEKEASFIVVKDANGRDIGRIIVDSFTDYAHYYVKKLRLFDHYWFYLNIKDTVDRRVRTRTKELFHADVVFAGLF